MLEKSRKILTLPIVILIIFIAHAAKYEASAPFYYNDETRHVMSSVYFRDVLHDLPIRNLREYTINYYLQYPALGLLVWPPFFYAVAGLAMTVFGTSLIVPKLLVGFFAALACAYLFLLVSRSQDAVTAAFVSVIFAFTPLVFEFSRFAILEVPTLALSLAAI